MLLPGTSRESANPKGVRQLRLCLFGSSCRVGDCQEGDNPPTMPALADWTLGIRHVGWVYLQRECKFASLVIAAKV